MFSAEVSPYPDSQLPKAVPTVVDKTELNDTVKNPSVFPEDIFSDDYYDSNTSGYDADDDSFHTITNVEYPSFMKSDEESEDDEYNHVGDDAAGYESDYEFHVDQHELIAEFSVVDLVATTDAMHFAKEN